MMVSALSGPALRRVALAATLVRRVGVLRVFSFCSVPLFSGFFFQLFPPPPEQLATRLGCGLLIACVRARLHKAIQFTNPQEETNTNTQNTPKPPPPPPTWSKAVNTEGQTRRLF